MDSKGGEELVVSTSTAASVGTHLEIGSGVDFGVVSEAPTV